MHIEALGLTLKDLAPTLVNHYPQKEVTKMRILTWEYFRC